MDKSFANFKSLLEIASFLNIFCQAARVSLRQARKNYEDKCRFGSAAAKLFNVRDVLHQFQGSASKGI
jgi:hypothetical protein